jgi:hypothetical protein
VLCSTVRDGCVWCVPRYVSMSLSFVHKNLPHKVMEILKCSRGNTYWLWPFVTVGATDCDKIPRILTLAGSSINPTFS